MRVLLIGNYPLDHQESMQRFSEMMLHGLKASGLAASVIQPQPFFGWIKKSSSGLGKWLGYLDKFILFPFLLRRELFKLRSEAHEGRIPIVHICDHSNAFYVWFLTDVPHVVTVHDLLAVRSARGEFAENPTWWSGRAFQRLILSGLKRCCFAVADSTASRDDFLRLTERNPGDVMVLPPALNYPYGPCEAVEVRRLLKLVFDCGEMRQEQRQQQPPARFFFHVGGSSWYKNRAGILRGFHAYQQQRNGANEQPPIALVMAGALPDANLLSLSAELGIEKDVHWLGQVTNEELAALYNAAVALVFPSLAEGFGWPPVEAQACGCPVIVSNRAPMTEAAGDAAIFVAPNEPEEIGAALLRMEKMSAEEREALKKRGFENVKRYSTEQMMKGYLKAYQEAASRMNRNGAKF